MKGMRIVGAMAKHVLMATGLHGTPGTAATSLALPRNLQSIEVWAKGRRG